MGTTADWRSGDFTPVLALQFLTKNIRLEKRIVTFDQKMKSNNYYYSKFVYVLPLNLKYDAVSAS